MRVPFRKMEYFVPLFGVVQGQHGDNCRGYHMRYRRPKLGRADSDLRQLLGPSRRGAVPTDHPDTDDACDDPRMIAPLDNA